MGDNMKHEIDLKKYQVHTDLAIEDIESTIENNYSKVEKINDNITITNVFIDSENSKKINKRIGNYITIEFKDATDYLNCEKLKEIVQKELIKILEKNNIKDSDSCMIIGLGNRDSTPDSLGPLTLDNIVVTNHLFTYGSVEDGFRKTYAFEPGVMAETGLETSDLLTNIIKGIKPNFIIVIDALASGSIDRLNKTIQITDTGINPGSGVGNNRKEISKDITGIPVIAIGIPTVVDAVTIVSDTINYIYKNYAYMKNNKDDPKQKLTLSSQINYLKKNYDITKEEKTNLLGILGTLSDEEIKELIYEILTPIGYNLMVTPKEVDFILKKLSNILSDSINAALHKKLR